MMANSHQLSNNEKFAKLARIYDLEKYFSWPLRKKVARVVGGKPKKILDVACGTGSQSYELAKRGHEVVGVDLSPEMLAVARRKNKNGFRIKFIEADATKLPFKDRSFDIATISLAVHEMPYEMGVKVLKEMRRVSKEEMIIVDFTGKLGSIIRLFEEENYRNFIKVGLGKYLTELGLKVKRREGFLGIVQIVVVNLTRPIVSERIWPL